jgi:hypothetical protein
MEFISVGPYCASAEIIKGHGLRKKSYPFDYIFSSLEMIKHCINDKFAIFLDKQYYRSGESPHNQSMHHSFYAKYIDTEILRRHHIADNASKYADDLANREIFIHHDLLINNDVYESFVRKCRRLLDLIEQNQKIVFVYYNCYTENFDDIVDFYLNFSGNKNIFVLGIFKNDSDKKMLYENDNCKIYQNYDTLVILDEIRYYMLNNDTI